MLFRFTFLRFDRSANALFLLDSKVESIFTCKMAPRPFAQRRHLRLGDFRVILQ